MDTNDPAFRTKPWIILLATSTAADPHHQQLPITMAAQHGANDRPRAVPDAVMNQSKSLGQGPRVPTTVTLSQTARAEQSTKDLLSVTQSINVPRYLKTRLIRGEEAREEF